MIAEAIAPLVNFELQRCLPEGCKMRGFSYDGRLTHVRILRQNNVWGLKNWHTVRTLVEVEFHEDHIVVIHKITPQTSARFFFDYSNPDTTVDTIVKKAVESL